MLRFISLIAVTIAAGQPALAAPQKEYGEGAGKRFEYTTELRANGFVHIAGALLGSRELFVLEVSPTGHVDGRFGDVPVDYQVGKKVRDAAVAELDGTRAVASAN